MHINAATLPHWRASESTISDDQPNVPSFPPCVTQYKATYGFSNQYSVQNTYVSRMSSSIHMEPH